MNITKLLGEVLARSHWSQEELARRLGVSFATLNSWVNGRSNPRENAQKRIIALHEEILQQRIKTKPAAHSGSLRVFFTTPYGGKSRYQTSIDAILQAIRRNNVAITPEDTASYLAMLAELQGQGLNQAQAHYAYIRQGIASADAVIIEATAEDIRVGHELTLALLFHKPTLILSQTQNFADYITHDLLTGAIYSTAGQAARTVQDFLHSATLGRAEASMQTLNLAADNLHSMALAKLRRLAKQEPGQFGQWAREAEQQPAKVAREIETLLGNLQPQPAWSVFAPVYNEDSPDYIQSGVATFVHNILRRQGIHRNDPIVEAAGGTGALSRQLVQRGFTNVALFDNSRPMLAEAFKLSAQTPEITIFEADIATLHLARPAKAIVWTDYSSNFALDPRQLSDMLSQLLHNIVPNGLLIFDVRTYSGWQVDFYSHPITTFATEKFQRIWLNKQNKATGIIDFDVYIRTRDADGAWAPWQRESMREYMWRLDDITAVIGTLPHAKLLAIYGDDFRKLRPADEEPGLAYLVLQKTA